MKIVETLALTIDKIVGRSLDWSYSWEGLHGSMAELGGEPIEVRRQAAQIADIYDSSFNSEGFKKERLTVGQAALFRVLDAEVDCCGSDYDVNLESAIAAFKLVMGWA